MGVARRTGLSLRDYGDIWEYVARHSSFAAADKLLAEFDEALKLLSDHPGAGPERRDLRPRLRSYPVGSYVLFYRRVRGGAELLRVLHGARDHAAIFRRGSKP